MTNDSPAWARSFLKEFEATLRRIVSEPKRWQFLRGDNRKLNFHRFPYAIVYSLPADMLFIKVVMHLHRRPFYWQERR
jgi:plasmid stabilization system protein ParE